MAAKDKQIVVKGSEAVVTALQLFPQADGSVVVIVAGGSKDSDGQVVGLSEARGRFQMSDPAIGLLFQIARQALRQENGLDDEPIKVLAPLELPKADEKAVPAAEAKP